MTPFARLRTYGAAGIVVIAWLGVAATAHASTPAGQRLSVSETLHHRSRSPLTTTWTSANCSAVASEVEESSGGEVELSQSPNGDLHGCFRVPALRTSTLLIALQTYANRTVPMSTRVVTNVSHSPSDGDFTLSTNAHTVRPGETISLLVHFSGNHSADIDGTPDLCWDSCQSGLLEESNVVHWITSSEFRVAYQVPQTAWFEEHGTSAFIHPLTTGRYSIGIACIVVTSDCALEPADAQVNVHLDVPHPGRCVSTTRCAYVTLSSKAAQVGDVISVRGWAPVSTIVGSPAGLSLIVTGAERHQSYAPFTARAVSKDAFSLIFARRPFAVHPDEPWGRLGTLHPLASTWSGVSPVSPDAGTARIAWCLPTGIDVTNGTANIRVPTTGVPIALKGTNLKDPGPAQAIPQCSSVLLDPHQRSTVYAGFDYALNANAPPEYLVGLYSRDSGATWRTVPAPPGYTVDDFAGFVRDTQGVAAMFYSPNSEEDGVDSQISFAVEVTADGGQAWTASTLGCPSVGPCISFGQYEWVNCAMGGTGQPFLVGSPAMSSRPGAVVWSSSSWVTLVNTCFSQQLVAVSSHRALLLDPSSPFPLLQSTDGGITWENIVLPPLPNTSFPVSDPSGSDSLLLTADGTLLASVANSASTEQTLYRLAPGAASWCAVPKVMGSYAAVGVPGPLRSSGIDVAWTQSNDASSENARAPTTLHVRSVASLHC